MKILQTIAGFGAKSGGTSTCTYDLLNAMHRQGCKVDLMTLTVKDTSDRLMGKGEEWIKALPNDGISPYGYSCNMNRFLQQADYDLYHTNGMWMHCNHETCVVARKKGKPYIITPHGMLYPQAMNRSTWKKKLLLAIGGVDKDLKLAICIHVTCIEEMEHYRALGYKNPVAVIPNPVPMPDFIKDIEKKNSIKRIGFLGRLHPRKNVEVLIDAWIMLGDKVKDSQLVIMGKGDAAYERMLRDKVRQYGLKNVEFVGFITGREKFEKLASLTALCVPSDFENFGMIVTEALSVGTPVIASQGTPWQDLNIHKCGYWINNDSEILAKTIQEVLDLPESKIAEMGRKGKRLVEEKYSDIKVAAMMKRLYEWIVVDRMEKNKKPEFVYE